MNLRERIGYYGHLALAILKSQWGAFSITNFNFQTFTSSWLPAAHHEFADMTMVSGSVISSTIDTGVVGLKWCRLRVIAKTLTGLASTGSIQVTVQAGTGAAITGPTQICQVTMDMATSDGALLGQAVGWSNAGFQSYAITCRALSAAGAVDTAVTAVVDVMFDAA